MSNLNRIENGRTCKVTWMISETAQAIKEQFGMKENSLVQMKRNLGKTGVIVSFNGRLLAMSENAAREVVVE